LATKLTPAELPSAIRPKEFPAKHLNWLCYCGLFGLLVFLCNPGVSAETDSSEITIAIDRGLGWVLANPATCKDGGFLDIVDEGLFYRTIKRLDTDNAQQALYQQASDDCLSRLASSPAFQQRLKKQDKTLFEHYHLLLATHLIESGRRQATGRDTVIAQAQGALANSRFENPTFRLTIALLLQHLGAQAPVNMDVLLDASLVSRVTQPAGLPFAAAPARRPPLLSRMQYYALVHEVAALTDFGHLPASSWLRERSSQLGLILQEGVRQSMMSADIDLLAELLLCNHMLGLSLTGPLRSGIDFLVTQQHADGSWGQQATHRQNRSRHSVQTATAALLAYQSAL
jgi:hypothetical protein